MRRTIPYFRVVPAGIEEPVVTRMVKAPIYGLGCANCISRLNGRDCGRCHVLAGVGDATTDAIMSSMMTSMTAQILPQLKTIVAKSAEAAEPTIRKVVVEDVLPKFGLAVVLGLVGGAVAAAAIGSWFATRRRA